MHAEDPVYPVSREVDILRIGRPSRPPRKPSNLSAFAGLEVDRRHQSDFVIGYPRILDSLVGGGPRFYDGRAGDLN